MDGTAPVTVVDLFPEERRRLLELLTSLSEAQWQLPTACAGWSVELLAEPGRLLRNLVPNRN